MKLFIGVIVLCYATGSSGETFQYEQMHKFGSGRRAIQNYRRVNFNGHPSPLPSTPPSNMALIKDPYPKLYQGKRRKGFDYKVFKTDFDYPPSAVGQRISCESFVPCTITHIAVETDEGIPIILRGGVGYKHIHAIVRAKPGDALRGNIRVFCNKGSDEH